MSVAQRKYLRTTKGRAYNLRRGAKTRAKKNNIDFALTNAFVYDKIKQGVCEVTGIPFKLIDEDTYGKHKSITPYAPTLDRIDSSKGYVRENVQMVIGMYNTAKMNWNHSDVIVLANALCNTKGGTNN